MRIITPSTLKEFWEIPKNSDSKADLETWIATVKKADWNNPHEVKAIFPSADQVGNERMVFNINHNKYRLIAKIRYKLKTVYIRFIGNHKEYDKIKNIDEI